jgi:DNA-binding response OmpR family regulator
MRLLVIEDEPRLVEVLKSALGRAGFVVDAVDTAADAREALALVAYDIDEELASNAIPVHVHHLRRKLTDMGATSEVHTVRGIGHLLTEGRR